MCDVLLLPGVNQMCDVLLLLGVNQICDVLLLPGVNQMCDVLLPPSVNPIAIQYVYIKTWLFQINFDLQYCNTIPLYMIIKTILKN
jgi:hypothetical protein